MEKRLSRSEYLFTLLFIFMLICAAGAFFIGVKIGIEKTENKYSAMLNKKVEMAKELQAYDQQYLVSFYHTIFLPYRDYQKKWFEYMNAIDLRSHTVDPSSLLKELGKLADEKYEAILPMTLPESSLLLIEAHQNYLKSLKLFSDATKKYQAKANAVNGTVLVAEIGKDAFFEEAKNFALKAQSQYYASIVKWNESVNPEIKGADLLSKRDLSTKEWKQLNVNIKNSVISDLLTAGKHYAPYFPQDVTIRVDDLIDSGQANKMNLTQISDIVNTLIGTGAVRQGDFINGKNKRYSKQAIPQLPFFFEF